MEQVEGDDQEVQCSLVLLKIFLQQHLAAQGQVLRRASSRNFMAPPDAMYNKHKEASDFRVLATVKKK